MFLTLLRKEIISHILTLRFGVTFILFILLVFASIYVTTSVYEQDVALWSACNRGSASHLKEIIKEEDNWRRIRRLMDWEGRLDAVPVPALSSVVPGLRPFTPISVNTGRDWYRNIGKGYEKNPLAGLLRMPDLVYIVSVVLSLLAVLFAFDSICGEKESGTLRLMLSNAVPRDSILLAKWVGGYVVLIVPFLIAAFGGLGYAWWSGNLGVNGENVRRLGILLFVACLYISVFFTLTVCVSAATHRSATSLFICLLIWVMWILVIPNLAPVVAKIIRPAPSVEKINAEKEAADKEVRMQIERLYASSGELNYGQAMQRKEERLRAEGETRKSRWDRFLAETTGRQTDLAQTLGRISPAVCWTYSAVALMGTGPSEYKQYEEARKRLMKGLQELRDRLRQVRRETGSSPAISEDDVPSLQVGQVGFGLAAKTALNDILILLILNVVFFLAGYVLFLRYDVR